MAVMLVTSTAVFFAPIVRGGGKNEHPMCRMHGGAEAIPCLTTY